LNGEGSKWNQLTCLELTKTSSKYEGAILPQMVRKLFKKYIKVQLHLSGHYIDGATHLKKFIFYFLCFAN